MSRVRAIAGHELTRRSAYFSVSVVAATAVGVFSIPVLIGVLGPGQWGLLAVLQVVGQMGAVVVAFGWGATGPSMVSALPRASRIPFYVDSLAVRGLLFLLAAPAAMLVGWALGADPLIAALAALTYVLPGMNAAWYFIGTNRPGALVLLESLPAVLGQVAGLLLVLIQPSLAAYLTATVLVTLLGVSASAWYVLTRADEGIRALPPRVHLRGVFRGQLPGFTTMISGSLVSNLPLVIVGALVPAMRPVFALVDRLFKYAIIVLAPVLQAIQSWVPEAGAQESPHRARRALGVATAIGLVGGACMAGLATPVSSLLSLGQAVVPWHIGALIGVAFLAECLAQIGGLAALVPLGGMRALALSSIVAAAVGLPVMAGLVALWGLEGAAVGMLLISVATAVWRVRAALRLARQAITAPIL